MPKHVAVLIMVMNCVLLCASFGEYMECKNVDGTKNTVIIDTCIYPEIILSDG